MKIVQLPQLYYPSVGGVQRVVETLSKGLVAAGHHVTVVTSNLISDEQLWKKYYSRMPDQEIRAGQAIVDGIDVVRYPVSTIIQKVLYEWPEHLLNKAGLHQWSELPAYRYFRKQPFCPRIIHGVIALKPDLMVASNLPSPFSYYCYLINKLTGIPYVVVPTLHVEAEWTADPVAMKILARANHLIALTTFERDILRSVGLPQSKIDVIGHGLDVVQSDNGPSLTNNHLPQELPQVTYVGRLTKNKGIDTLIRAMPQVWKKMPDARLVLAGATNGKSEAYLNHELERLETADRCKVSVIGDFGEAEKSSIFSSCSMVAVPSIDEAFGLSYLEAWSYRKPVIAVRDSAPASFIEHGKDGLLVRVRDPQEVSTAILSLLEDDALRIRLGNNGYEKLLSDFSQEQMINRTIKVYEKALSA